MTFTGLNQMLKRKKRKKKKMEMQKSFKKNPKSAVWVKNIGGACVGNHIGAMKYTLDTRGYCGHGTCLTKTFYR